MTQELPLPRRQIMRERMRMAQVRKAFGQALAAGRKDDLRTFYIACTRYLENALNRLHAQDQRIIEKLTPRIAADDGASQELLSGFQASLEASSEALDELLMALEDLERERSSQETFKQASLRFMDVFLNILAVRRHSSQHLEEEHFTLTDWEEVADVTEATLANEQQLFQKACATAPEGLSPEIFQVGPPPA